MTLRNSTEPGAFGQRHRAGRVRDGDRHVQHLGQALARGHGALHHRILHGQRADGIEEALDVEQERHHHADVERAVQHHRAADHDDDRHGDAGQRVDDRHHHLRVLRGREVGEQVGVRLVVVERRVDRLPGHPLHRAHAVDGLGQRAVGDRIGLVRRHEGYPRLGQPEHADDEQHRHDRQGQQPELPVEPEHAADDAEQQHDVADREHRGLEELLHRVHVALQPRHQPADLGLVHEATARRAADGRTSPRGCRTARSRPPCRPTAPARGSRRS